MVREVIEGRLFYLIEYEDRLVLITDKDEGTVVSKAGIGCEKHRDSISCVALNYEKIELMGTELEEILRKYHGRKVRIVIEVIE